MLIIVLCGSIAHAQTYKIAGIVVDEGLNPLQGVSVVAIRHPDRITLGQVTTDNKGRFSIAANTDKPIDIQITHVSFANEKIALSKACDTTLIVSLATKNYELKAITVSDKQKTIGYRDGNIVINVGSLTGIKSEKASDVLRKLPGVIVSEQGVITLHGQSVEINLDGQELKAVDPIMLLKLLPAESLSEIELVPNKTSQYDASAGAVINIVSKRRLTNGYNVNTSISGVIDRNGKADGSPGIYWMFKRDKILFSNTLSYDAYTNSDKAETYTDFTKSGQHMLEYSDEIFRSRRVVDNANLSWDVGKERKLDFNLFLFNGWENRKMTDEQIIGNDTTNYFIKPHPYHFVLSAYAGYSNKIGTLSYGMIYNKTTYDYNYHNVYDSGKVQDMTLKRNIRNLQHVGKLDLLKNYLDSRLTLKAGAKDELSQINNDDTYAPVLYANTIFTGQENILALYGSLSYKFSDKFSVYGGYRTEYTNFKLNVKSSKEKTTRNYWNSLPSAIANWKISKDYRMSLALSGSISRPSYENLMPGVNYWNDKEYSKGNPLLDPTKDYRVKLNNRLFDKFDLGIEGKYVKDLSQEVMIEQDGGVTESFYINAVDSRGIGVFADLPFEAFNTKLSGQINGGYSWGEYINPHNGFQLLEEDKRYHSTYVSCNLDYSVTSRLELNGYAFYEAKSHELQVETNGNYYCNFGTQYSVLKDKNLVFAFTVKDAFNSDKTHCVNRYNSAVRVADVKPNSQTFTLSVSYRFGKGHKIEKSPASDPNDTERFF